MMYVELLLCLIVLPCLAVAFAGKNRKTWYIDTVIASMSAAVSASVLGGQVTGLAFSLATGFVIIAAARNSARAPGAGFPVPGKDVAGTATGTACEHPLQSLSDPRA